MAVACANQREGDRCDPLNGNADCEPGLICVRAERLALVEVGAVCCPPPDEGQGAVKECKATQDVDGGNVIAPSLPMDGAAPSETETPSPTRDAATADGAPGDEAD